MELSAATRDDVAVVARQIFGAAQVTRTRDPSNVVALQSRPQVQFGCRFVGRGRVACTEKTKRRVQRGVCSSRVLRLFAGVTTQPVHYANTALEQFVVEV